MRRLPPSRLSSIPNLGVFWCLAAGLVLLSAAIIWRMPDVDGVRLLIRATARTSLVFFCLAYVAQAAFTLWPASHTKWLRQHRRQWGWLLVVSHTLHAGGIWAFTQMAPELFAQLTPMVTIVTGGVAYVLLWLMGVTSFDRSAAWIGRAAWAHLHTWGSHYLWLSFMVAYAKRVPKDAAYLAPVLLLLLVMGLRWRARVNTPRPAASSGMGAGSGTAVVGSNAPL
jgi:sulfoxide reductase heme-binding subunit YedZ